MPSATAAGHALDGQFSNDSGWGGRNQRIGLGARLHHLPSNVSKDKGRVKFTLTPSRFFFKLWLQFSS